MCECDGNYKFFLDVIYIMIVALIINSKKRKVMLNFQIFPKSAYCLNFFRNYWISKKLLKFFYNFFMFGNSLWSFVNFWRIVMSHECLIEATLF